MTRATRQSPTAPVELDAEFDTNAPVLTASTDGPAGPGAALRLAKASALGVVRGASGLTKGGGAVGAYLLGHGYSLARSALARATRPGAAPVDEVVVAAAGGPNRRRRGLRRVVVLGALGTAAVAGVAAWRLRRPEPAPVAARPPSVRDTESDTDAAEQQQ